MVHLGPEALVSSSFHIFFSLSERYYSPFWNARLVPRGQCKLT